MRQNHPQPRRSGKARQTAAMKVGLARGPASSFSAVPPLSSPARRAAVGSTSHEIVHAPDAGGSAASRLPQADVAVSILGRTRGAGRSVGMEVASLGGTSRGRWGDQGSEGSVMGLVRPKNGTPSRAESAAATIPRSRGRPRKSDRKVQLWPHLPEPVVHWISSNAQVRNCTPSEEAKNLLQDLYDQGMGITSRSAIRTENLDIAATIASPLKSGKENDPASRLGVRIVRLEGEGIKTLEDRMGTRQLDASLLDGLQHLMEALIGKIGTATRRNPPKGVSRDGRPPMTASQYKNGTDKGTPPPRLASRATRPDWWPV